MEETNNMKSKCPVCKSNNVYIHKRGYSVVLGLVGMVITFVAYVIYWIIDSDYANQNEMVQSMMITIATKQFLFAAALGLLFGFIGKNQLKCKCLKCGNKFSI